MKSLLPGLVAVAACGCISVPVSHSLPDPGPVLPRSIRVQLVEDGSVVVREVALEEYVRATAISEFAPPDGDLALVEKMLELQTIISRTYAVAHLGRHEREGFDLCATTHCQLFEPGRLRTSRWASVAAEASARTSGAVLRFEGRPAEALFHADCGGHTSAPAQVWGRGDLPYLLGRVDDGVAVDAHASWEYRVPVDRMTVALNADSRTQFTGELDGVDVIDRDEAGRATRVSIRARVRSTEQLAAVLVRGEELRQVLTRAFGARTIRSTWFGVTRLGSTFSFSGRGFGHGVGLCQAGALARLRAGAEPVDVLRYYYPGTTLGF